jgi:hypothetical protein
MPISGISEQDRGLGRLKQDKLSWPVWLAIGYAGIALPLVCHASTFSEPPEHPQWQSGDLHDQVGFVLSGTVGFAFYPLILYPITCLALLLWREERFANVTAVRFGVATGLPVAAWYSAILGIVALDVPNLLSTQWIGVLLFGLFGVLTPFFLWAALRIGLWSRRKLRIPWIVVGIVVAILMGLCQAFNQEFIIYSPATALLISMMFAPFWCFDAYLAMTLRLLWRYPERVQFSIRHLLVVITWLASFLGACRWAIVLSLQEYAKLPLEPPDNCYVATAAARGHTKLVRSRRIVVAGEVDVRVNRQLQVLKAGELALRALLPTAHHRLRRIYDHIGPCFAQRLNHACLADLAYLTLKPLEWCVYIALIGLLGRQRTWIDRLYGRSG